MMQSDDLLATERPAPTWMQQIVTLPEGGAWTGAAASALCNGYAMAEAVYGGDLGENAGLTAFAYLWRRFGPPWWGSDDYKDLVEYILGTSHPAVFLTLRLSGSRLSYGVGYLITRALEQELAHPQCQDGKAVVQHAIQDALRELLRPVYIRDVAITILGRLSDEAAALCDPSAERSPYAGYGIPKKALDSFIKSSARPLRKQDRLATAAREVT